MDDHQKKDEEKVILTFLEQTKDGAYAPIAESSLAFARVKPQTELVEEKEYIYNVR